MCQQRPSSETGRTTRQLGLLRELDVEGRLLGFGCRERCLNLLDFALENLKLFRVDPLVLGEDRLVASLPPFVVLLEQFRLMLRRLEFGLEHADLLLEGLNLGLCGTKLSFKRRDLAQVRLVLVAQGVVALAEKLSGVNRLEKLGVLGGAGEGVSDPRPFLRV